MQFVLFTLDEGRYALRLSDVDRVSPVVEIVPLPGAPEIVLGIVNVAGRIIPVMDIRKCFHRSERPLDLSDRLIVARTSERVVGIIADAVLGVVQQPASEVVAAEQILPSIKYVEGVFNLDDGMVFVHDLDKLLSRDEERVLAEALRSGA